MSKSLITQQASIGSRHAFVCGMKSLAEFLSRYCVGPNRAFRNLSVFPLLAAETFSDGPGYLLADDAFAQGLARVKECDEAGSVPELRFENLSDEAVLLLDGEELIGAKQNRVLNVTVLAPPRASITIPVSCVEAGRWHMDSADMRSSPNVMFSSVRASKASQVSESMRRSTARTSDQGKVWDLLARKASRLGSPSRTGAMAAMYEKHALTIDEYVRAFACDEQQIGAAFAINDELMGIDAFDHPSTLRSLLPKLVRSYALDAIDSPEAESAGDAPKGVETFLRTLATVPAITQPAVGLGKDVRLRGDSITGAALWWEDHYVHTCAFALRNVVSPNSQGSRINRPSGRRR